MERSRLIHRYAARHCSYEKLNAFDLQFMQGNAMPQVYDDKIRRVLD